MLSLTANAIYQFKAILDNQGYADFGVRLYLKPGG